VLFSRHLTVELKMKAVLVDYFVYYCVVQKVMYAQQNKGHSNCRNIHNNIKRNERGKLIEMLFSITVLCMFISGLVS